MNVGSKKEHKIVSFLILLFLATLIVWGCTATPVSSGTDKASYRLLHEGWSQQIDGKLTPLTDIQDFTPIALGEPLTFVCTLPQLHDGDVLLFYSEQQEVETTVDGVNIHQFVMDDHFTFLKTPGSAWNQVDLDASMSGATCTLTFRAQIARYQNNIYDIYLIDNVHVDGLRQSLLWLRVSFAVGLLLLMVIAQVNARLWKYARRKRYFYALGQLYLCVFLWMLGELNAYDILFARPVLSYLLSEFFVRLIPIALIALARNSTNRYDHPRVLSALEYIAVANFLAPWVVMAVPDVAMLEMQWLNRTVYFAISAVLFYVSVEKFGHFKMLEDEEYPSLALWVLMLGGMIDIVLQYSTPERAPLAGIFTVISFVVYTIVIFMTFTAIGAKREEEKRELARSYQQLQNTSLVQQIKAHFIFNVLNTISAFCKQDARKADEAIHTFAKYLRSYLFLINQQELISIESELEMVKNYLLIEQMRFGTKLNFSFDLHETAFFVPPISVQTLVENAVVHGVRESETDVHITIRTVRTQKAVQVQVIDTGVGFDTTATPNEKSVGLRNIERRLRLMSGGTLRIESAVGKGTTATITIPFVAEPL